MLINVPIQHSAFGRTTKRGDAMLATPVGKDGMRTYLETDELHDLMLALSWNVVARQDDGHLLPKWIGRHLGTCEELEVL